jgi:hypothetical protein
MDCLGEENRKYGQLDGENGRMCNIQHGFPNRRWSSGCQIDIVNSLRRIEAEIIDRGVGDEL